MRSDLHRPEVTLTGTYFVRTGSEDGERVRQHGERSERDDDDLGATRRADLPSLQRVVDHNEPARDVRVWKRGMRGQLLFLPLLRRATCPVVQPQLCRMNLAFACACVGVKCACTRPLVTLATVQRACGSRDPHDLGN